MPIQLVEATGALLIGISALLLVLAGRSPAGGAIFIGAVAAYTLCRQVLFPFRAEPRITSFGRRLTLAGSALVLAAGVLVSVLA